MTTSRTISKVLAGAEDLLLGAGTAMQNRNGNVVPIKKLNLPFIFATIADIEAADTAKHARAILNTLGEAKEYYYDSASTATVDGVDVLLPDSGIGRWLSVINFGTLASTSGTTKVGHVYDEAPEYLKTLSDITNGDTVSIARWIGDQSVINAIKARTSAVNLATYINTAVNDLNTEGGGSLRLFAGKYVCESQITVKGKVALRGDSIGATLLDIKGNFDLFSDAGSSQSDFSLSDMTVQRTSGTGYFGKLTTHDRLLFNRILTIGTGYWELNGCFMPELTRVFCTSGASIILWSSNHLTGGTWGEGAVLNHCLVDAAAQGFNLIHQRNAVLNNCIGRNSSGTYGCGFVIEYENDDVTLNSCWAYGNVRDGYYVEGNVANGCRNIKFNDATAYSNGEAGLNFDANFKHCKVTGGTFRNNLTTFAPGTGHGIILAGSSDVVISGAAIHNNAAHGIADLSNPYKRVYTNNDIKDNGGYGIYLAATPAAMTISGNQSVGNTSGKINTWALSYGIYDDAAWQTYSATFYKSDGSTAVTTTGGFTKAIRFGNTVKIMGAFTVTSGTLNGLTYITLPINVNRGGSGAGIETLIMRGNTYGDVSGAKQVDNRYFTDKMAFPGLSSTDTQVQFEFEYEI